MGGGSAPPRFLLLFQPLAERFPRDVLRIPN
jgi:hypothetical protein